MSLFAGNVSHRASPEEVRSFFSKFGPCRVDVKRGYCFVDYDDDRDAEVARMDTNGKDFHGMKLNVEWSKKHMARTAGGGRGGDWDRGRPGRYGDGGRFRDYDRDHRRRYDSGYDRDRHDRDRDYDYRHGRDADRDRDDLRYDRGRYDRDQRGRDVGRDVDRDRYDRDASGRGRDRDRSPERNRDRSRERRSRSYDNGERDDDKIRRGGDSPRRGDDLDRDVHRSMKDKNGHENEKSPEGDVRKGGVDAPAVDAEGLAARESGAAGVSRAGADGDRYGDRDPDRRRPREGSDGDYEDDDYKRRRVDRDSEDSRDRDAGGVGSGGDGNGDTAEDGRPDVEGKAAKAFADDGIKEGDGAGVEKGKAYVGAEASAGANGDPETPADAAF